MSAARRARDPLAILEKELLARLGLESDTTPEQVQATHEAVVEFLAGAPRSLRGWARAQAAAADEAYTLLSDPVELGRSAGVHQAPDGTRRASKANPDTPPPAPTLPAAEAPSSPDVAASPAHAAAAGPPARSGRRAAPAPVPPTPSGELLDELIAEVTPSAHRDEVRAPQPEPRSGATRRAASSWSTTIRRPLTFALVAVAAVAAGFFIYQAGSEPATAASGSTPTAVASPTLDEAQVATLMARIQADPNDTDALMGLGDAFFQAGQYDVSASWLAKLVAIEPDNVRALLALGAATFNTGNVTDAEQYWLSVVDLDPNNVEAHYDLGFLYLQQQPPDVAGVQREWQKVVELAPGTEVAQNVQAHLDALGSAVPTATPAPSAPVATP